MRATGGLFIAAAVLLILPGALSAPMGSTSPDPAAEAPLLAQQYLEALPENMDDPGFVQRAFIAQMERQGAVPLGTTAAMQAASDAERPVERRFYDGHLVCDLNGDGIQDLVFNRFDIDTGLSYVYAYSGEDGSYLWMRSNQYFLSFGMFDRPGDPHPRAPIEPEFLSPAGQDLNLDGVCDLVTVSFTYTVLATPGTGNPAVYRFVVDLRALSGVDGVPIWETTYESQMVQGGIGDPLFFAEVLNFPTGFEMFASPSGPRVVLKTTDVFFQFHRRIELDGGDTILMNVNEHVQLYDATDGSQIWQRDLWFYEDAERARTTWVTGVDDFTGDGEPDIVLDQYLISNPSGDPLTDPLTGEPQYRIGKGMSVLVIDNADGSDVWSASILEEDVVRTRPAEEENFQEMLWSHAQVLQDVTGDGVPEVMALFLTQELNALGTVNGGFQTHFVPLDGASGARLWDGDVRYQGWGFAQGMSATGEAVPYVALATVDITTAPPPAGRFPPKEVRVSVVRADDGAPVWTYEDRFAQDSYLSSDLALQQYLTSLAPWDWDDDGVLDVLTPGQYVPAGDGQALLATATTRFEVRSGADGDTLSDFEVWGSNAEAVQCDGAPGLVTTITGHARRLDVTRVDGATGDELWRVPVWFDETPTAANAGMDIVFLGARCGDDVDGRTNYLINLGLYSEARGFEIVPIRGFVEDGAVQWQTPKLSSVPPMYGTLEDLAGPQQGWDLWRVAGFVVAPAAIGIGLGIALGLILAAAHRGRAWARDLPNLYIILMVLALLLPGAAGAIAVTGVPPALADDALAPSTPLEAPAETVTSQPGGATAALSATTAADPSRPAAPPTAQSRSDLVRRLAAADDAFAIGEVLGDHYANQYASESLLFEENATVTFPYVLGDVDGDRIQDVAIDTYCVQYDACPRTTAAIRFGTDPDEYLDKVRDGEHCGFGHSLVLRSGATGEVMWQRDLYEGNPTPYAGCTMVFVAGTVPDPNGEPAVLLHRVAVTDTILSYVSRIEHTLELLDPVQGNAIWTYQTEGTYERLALSNYLVATGDEFLLNPVYQADGNGSLIVQSVGFQATFGDTFQNPPSSPFYATLPLLLSYQPMERLVRLDLTATGTNTPVWETEPFDIDPEQSVLPYILDHPTPHGRLPIRAVSDSAWPSIARRDFWRADPCCGDVTGDGQSDIVYTTIEWVTTPMVNPDGPYFLASRLLVVDGATGETVTDVIVEEGTDVPGSQGFPLPDDGIYEVWTQTVGDVDGGGADILVHQVYYDFDYRHTLSMRNANGTELWRLESPRDLRVMPIGDADGDGGQDIVVVEWTWWEHPLANAYGRSNVTWTPLVAYSGATGQVLWRLDGFQAPLDITGVFDNLERNGLPDVDGDGVGEVPVDDPVFLPDQTIVHRNQIRSGTDGSLHFTLVTVGSLAIPTGAADITGDGIAEIAVLNGDPNDVWVTMFDGASGSALWSQRLLESRISSSSSSSWNFLIEDLRSDAEGIGDLLVNLQYRSSSVSSFIFTNSFGYRLVTYEAPHGTEGWSTPGQTEFTNASVIEGSSPATQAFVDHFSPEGYEVLGTVPEGKTPWLVAAVMLAATFIAATVATAVRRWE